MPHIHRCPSCGELYEFHSWSVEDQGVCPDCRRKAKENSR